MIISEWNHSDEEKIEILDLAMKTFGKCELTNSDYFDWQYLKNPAGEATIITVKDPDKNNTIVGANSFLPMDFIFNKNHLKCLLSCNSIIHPNYRNKGIFTQLVSKIPEIFFTKQFSFIYGIPNLNSTKIFKKNQFMEISKLPLLIKPLNLSTYFKSSFSKIIKPFDIFWKPKYSISSNIKLIENHFDVEFNNLIQKSFNRFSLFHFKNKEYLQWRYLDHPTRNYQVLTLSDNSKLIGYIVTREMNIFSKKLGVIVDLLVDPLYTNKMDFQLLIKKTLLDFWNNDVTMVLSTSKIGYLENEILHKSGFFTAPSFLKQEKLPLIISTFNDNSELVQNFDNWSFTLGDYDVF
jgi:ribosomal protein S18 acetylase RimI-like enzyme